MGPYSVNLRFTYTPATVSIPSYQLVVDAVSANNMTSLIFVYHHTDAGAHIFEGVATPDQLLTIPETEPDPDSEFPTKFRLATVEFASASPDVIQEAKTDIAAAVDRLVTGLTKSENLSIIEEVTYGILGNSHSTSSFIAFP
jgi:hypothetical protein